jgi:lysophospholipase L1-like esterase
MKKSIIILLFALPLFITARGQQPLTAADSAKYAIYWWHSKDMYDNLPVIKNSIVFLGNSITDGGEWAEFFSNSKCINRGISADVTEGILLRLSAITKLKPAKIFLLIGVNDISRDIPVDQITANYRQILTRIKSETPKTKVFVQSVMPVNPVTNPKIPHTSKTDRIIALNKNLESLASEFGYQYIDLFSIMADSNNYLPKKYSLDGLHLTYAGYKVWVDAIRPYVK